MPGVGEKVPAVEARDQVRVKLDDIVCSGERTRCNIHQPKDDSWMTLDVKEADRDTIYVTVRNALSKIHLLKVKTNISDFLFRTSIRNARRNWSARSTTVAAPGVASANWSSC